MRITAWSLPRGSRFGAKCAAQKTRRARSRHVLLCDGGSINEAALAPRSPRNNPSPVIRLGHSPQDSCVNSRVSGLPCFDDSVGFDFSQCFNRSPHDSATMVRIRHATRCGLGAKSGQRTELKARDRPLFSVRGFRILRHPGGEPAPELVLADLQSTKQVERLEVLNHHFARLDLCDVTLGHIPAYRLQLGGKLGARQSLRFADFLDQRPDDVLMFSGGHEKAAGQSVGECGRVL